MKNRTFILLAILVVASMVFTACAAPVATAPAGEAAAPGGEAAAAADDLSRPHPILSDVRVRQAIAHCIDRSALLAAVYPYVDDETRPTLLMDSFLPKSHWAYSGPYTDYEYSVEKGVALLEEAGWTDEDGDGFRSNADGLPLQLTFTSTNAQFRQTWMAVAEQQLSACGIFTIRQHTPGSWWFGDTTGLARRDFELGAYAWVGQSDPSGQTLYSCEQIPTPGNNWEGQNYMGWCNQAASEAVVLANNTLLREDRIPAYDLVQEEFAKDMISLPVFQRAEAEAWSKNLEGLVVDPTEYGTASGDQWSLADGRDTIVVGFSQEPASMWSLVESAAVNFQAVQLNGVVWSEYNYDFQPALLKQLSTIDSGLATNAEVPVKAGDMVWNAAGEPEALAEGTEVLVGGEKIAYDGTSELSLPQLTVTYEFNEYTWSDGVAGTVADFELANRINCEKDSGATSFINCESFASTTYADDGTLAFTVTYLPGVQSPTYFTPAFGRSNGPALYPSHQVLADGRNLADVPAAEWSTLPEIAEKPLSWGPFVVTEWVKGQQMTLEANPYYYKGAPKTARIVIVFVQDTTQLVAQLISGDVDYVEKATLAGGAEVQLVKDAGDAGQLNFEIIASPTWEHIDMNLFVKEK